VRPDNDCNNEREDEDMNEDRTKQRADWLDHQIDMATMGHDGAVVAAVRMWMSMCGQEGEDDVDELITSLSKRGVTGIAEQLESSLDAYRKSRATSTSRAIADSPEAKIAGAIGGIRAGMETLTALGVDFRLTFAPATDEHEVEPWWASFELMGHVQFNGLVRTPRGRYPALVTVVSLHEPPHARHVGRSAVYQIIELTAEEAAQRLVPYGATITPTAEIAQVMRGVADDKIHWTNLREIVGDDDPLPFDQTDGGGA